VYESHKPHQWKNSFAGVSELSILQAHLKFRCRKEPNLDLNLSDIVAKVSERAARWQQTSRCAWLLLWILFDLSIFWVHKQSYWTKREQKIKLTMLFDRCCRRGLCAGRTKTAADWHLQCSSFLLFPGPAL